MLVEKRDGTIQEFDRKKIETAILKAFKDVDDTDEYAIQKAVNIADHIENLDKEKMSVEEIQDKIENGLMACKKKNVARAYIRYRYDREKNREKNSILVKKIMVRANALVNDRSNANVDEASFSGREKEASADIGKLAALKYGGLSDEVAKAHKEMLIYQHDLEKAIYGVHNCLNLNFQEIFENGFKTRNGDVRPPRSYATATQLYAVAYQCQSQVQFGGVGSIHTDIDLAPFVKLSFYKHYLTGLKYLRKYSDDILDKLKEIYNEALPRIDDKDYFGEYGDVYEYAMDMLEKEGQQSTQALYHNLNTLESRQGSQVPFTSINLGRDTTPEGRLVSKWIFKASIDGIGKHHLTSIFPISIFQYKPGINANKEDPNYDLKQLALESMSKRIYPNWCNCNWSQAHEDDNNPDTFFATMGGCKL